MKAVTALSCTTGTTVSSGISNGRVQRNRDGENAEIQMYISKLKDLVPFMPKNRKLSKLEVIQHVIDYICDLQSALESNPEANNFDAAAVLGNPQILEVLTQRQPLGVRASPNTILSPNPSSMVPQNNFHSGSEVSPVSHNTEKPASS